MSSSLDAIKRVVAAFERSDWAEVDVRWGTLRVHLLSAPPTSPPMAAPSTAPVTLRATGRPAPDGAGNDQRDEHSQAPSPAPAPVPAPAGAHVVVPMSPGIFWRSPEPGAPPFADVGDTVDASTTVCIIEVMKLMYHLKAGVSGEVVAVYVENGVGVQKGQALFAIAPSGSGP